MNVEDKKETSAHLATIFGSSIRVICEREEGGGKRGRRKEGRKRRKWGSIMHHVCMLFSLNTPHLYYWVTVDLNGFVVHLNRKPYQSPQDKAA